MGLFFPRPMRYWGGVKTICLKFWEQIFLFHFTSYKLKDFFCLLLEMKIFSQ